MAQISGIVNAVAMSFYDGNPDMVKGVWQALLYVRHATLRHEGRDDSALADLGSNSKQCGSLTNLEPECTFLGDSLPISWAPLKGWD